MINLILENDQQVEISINEKIILDFLYRWIRPIRVGDLKNYLNVKHSTLNSQLQNLEEKHLIKWKRYGSVELTEKGKKYSSHLTRHHRILELFLVETLAISVLEAHKISTEITPVASCKFIHYIVQKFGEHDKCPCGNEIPQIEGECSIGGI